MAQLMGESLPIFCSGSLLLKLNRNMGSLESCIEGCGSAQGVVGSRNPSPNSLRVVLDSCDIVLQGHLLVAHSLSVTFLK